ncbi:iduronate 2-sulfatase [Rhodopirellula rubra]|uniref:Iduronate 2-sulfatase n=1 Tax=Aporhodopirellula rubra TaxID=980271 RepID=A0A7W5E3D0_9BACT|nr:sulfatase [Aporhodopirellula rubra]MBB3209461.1 iduronate 2-sulfatase [Aporhodopirellula rubra]
MIRSAALLIVVCVLIGGVGPAHAEAESRPNVLMILVDDLKPTLGCYGDVHAKSPHLDALAARGMRFDAAYCNQAVCAPSRFTLMLGAHSTSTGLYGLGSHLRKLVPDAVTLPQYFQRHGYRTESMGKVFHIGHGNHGDPDSFSVPHHHEKVIEYVDPESTPSGELTREEAFFTNHRVADNNSLPRGAAFESPDVEDNAYADGRIAELAAARLRHAKQRRQADGTPFFMVVGFARPHLPFSAPKKYWDMHDRESLPMPVVKTSPLDSPIEAGKPNGQGEIRNYFPVPDKNSPAAIDDQLTRTLIHGYYASTSYVDAQIGKVVAELDRLELSDDTIIVLWGDHGFHLGDHGFWTKHTNYEQAARIPIFIVAPGVTQPNSQTAQLTETVDIYPTLAELAGLPNPTGPQSIDGVSIVPVLKDGNARVRDHAYHVFPRFGLGRAIRTSRYRLVEWSKPAAPERDATYELFDMKTDPNETRNVANEQPSVLRSLLQILDEYPSPHANL